MYSATDNCLPQFSKINPHQIEQEVNNLLIANKQLIKRLIAPNKIYTWENFVSPMQDFEVHLEYILGIVSHLKDVLSNKSINDIYYKISPEISRYRLEIYQSKDFYEAYISIIHGPNNKNLSAEQKRVILNILKNFELCGVNLQLNEKEQLVYLCSNLNKLENTFENNISNSVKSWSLHISDIEILKGLPENIITTLRDEANKQKKSGWLIKLDPSHYEAIMRNADNRVLRETLYTAFTTIASNRGPHNHKFDNNSIIFQILEIRAKIAKLLKFDNYLEYSLSTKMMKNPSDVYNFLNRLLIYSQNIALTEFEELKKYGLENNIIDLRSWDIPYLSEKLFREKYGFSESGPLHLFQEDKVLEGMFRISETLFDIRIIEENIFDKWHEDVRLFNVYNNNMNLLGQFYIDLYARPLKQSGAWCGECRTRLKRSDNTIQTPVVFIVTNFLKDTNIQFTHKNILTLFHEFGHCLQKILTNIDYPSIGGDHGIPLDTIEFASLFMEEWCWREESLAYLTNGDNTNNIKIIESRKFQAGIRLIEQIELSLFDLTLHQHHYAEHTNFNAQEVFNTIRQNIGVLPIEEFNRFHNSFRHIFSNCFAAGYYSYLLSETFSADAFDYFVEYNLFDIEIGKQFLSAILGQGGVEDFIALFVKFRKRAPTILPLLKRYNVKLPKKLLIECNINSESANVCFPSNS